ncbi:low temperature requirement protein A [Ancylobacter sp. G4_0304]|uniref:low temperature requirement protein A n=1 Tax=Ancylobacter sp. G4_0304 TaxID=3114289 RepID=UPI0039C5EB56
MAVFLDVSEDATDTITHSDDPGRIGAYFHYLHVILVAGIIATAVGNDLVLAHPHDAVKTAYALVLSAGPAIYLLGSAIYKKVVYGVVPASHIAGVVLLTTIVPLTSYVDLLTVGWLTTIIMLAVSFWEGRLLRKHRSDQVARQGAH